MAPPHLHKLSLLAAALYEPHHRFRCNVCREIGHGPLYHCSQCSFDVHPACAANLDVEDHFSHSEHSLHRRHSTDNRHTCDGCGLKIHGFFYRCEICDFNLHPTCARAPRFIMHRMAHQHPLQLIRFSNDTTTTTTIPCQACKLPLHHFCYACTVCDQHHFHQFCASLNDQILHPDHAIHPLFITYDPASQDLRPRQCSHCQRRIVLGLHYHCKPCNFSLHPGCTNIVHEIPEYSATVSLLTTVSYLQALQNNVHTKTSTYNTTYPSLASSSATRISTQKSAVPSPGSVSSSTCGLIPHETRFEKALAASMANADNQCTTSYTDDESNVCPICYEVFEVENPQSKTSCGHQFHLECILDWMDRSPMCPICRSEVRIML